MGGGSIFAFIVGIIRFINLKSLFYFLVFVFVAGYFIYQKYGDRILQSSIIQNNTYVKGAREFISNASQTIKQITQ